MSIIQHLFGVPILREVLNLNLNEIKIFCDSLRNLNHGRNKSNVGGWQSFDFTDQLFKIKNFEKIIILKTKELAKIYKLKQSIDYSISSVWVNYNNKNNYNMKHMHPDCIFSGVFYVDCKIDNPAQITFFHPAYDLLGYDWNEDLFENFVEENSSLWNFDPEPNQLIIFPSWLQHQVSPNPSDEIRISISFNITKNDK